MNAEPPDGGVVQDIAVGAQGEDIAEANFAAATVLARQNYIVFEAENVAVLETVRFANNVLARPSEAAWRDACEMPSFAVPLTIIVGKVFDERQRGAVPCAVQVRGEAAARAGDGAELSAGDAGADEVAFNNEGPRCSRRWNRRACCAGLGGEGKSGDRRGAEEVFHALTTRERRAWIDRLVSLMSALQKNDCPPHRRGTAFMQILLRYLRHLD